MDRSDLFDAVAGAVARDADRAARVDDDQMKRSREAAAIDKVGDQLGEALLIELVHAASVARKKSRVFRTGSVTE
jgi:hypothetical protein